MSDNMALLYAVGLYVVGIGLLIANYGSFAATVVRWSKKPLIKPGTNKIKQPSLTPKEVICCYIPLYQACVVRKALYKKSGIFGPLSVIAGIGIVGNLINKFLLPINGYVMFVFSIIMIISLVIFFIVYAVITANCASVYGFSYFMIVLCFLLPHWLCWYLHNNIPNKMRKVYKEEIFDEHRGDTVIRQRFNK